MAAALHLSGWGAGERNDGTALASSRLRDHLDRLALFFQSGPDAGDEEVRSQAAHQNLSGTDVRRDGVVPLVGIGYGDRGTALFHDSSVRGRETCWRSFAHRQVVRLVAAGLARRVHIYLCAAASGKRNSR